MEHEKQKLNDMVKEFLNYDNQIAQTEKTVSYTHLRAHET